MPARREKLDEIILQTSDKFLREAEQSPTLMADMAAMEKYMAESYSERIFIELLQNADDCNSKCVAVKQVNNDLYFANDGKPFDANDIVAICRTGASSKTRGKNIGYRGVGFKSSAHLSDQILIFSDGVSFTFSKKHCAKTLNISESDIPTVRIPFLVENISDSIKREIACFERRGHKTVFVFKNANISLLEAELDDLTPDVFIFLNSIIKCDIDMANKRETLCFKRIPCSYGYDFSAIQKDGDFWRVFKDKNSSIALKTKENKMVECDIKEAIYHSFLPTGDKAPYKIKINSDFSTDPSRKHISLDNFTKTSLEQAAHQIFRLIQAVVNGELIPNASHILLIFSEQNAFSAVNSVFISYLKEMLQTMQVSLQNGNRVSVSDYKLFPNWIDNAEADALRKYSAYIRQVSLPQYIYENYIGVDKFISIYSRALFTQDDMIEALSEEELSKKLSQETYGKIVANIVRSVHINSQMNDREYDVKKLMEPVVQNENSQSLFEIIGNQLSISDIEWVRMKTGTEMPVHRNERRVSVEPEKVITQSKVPIIAKWRSAEQQVVQIEEFLGHKAFDVSKRNLGYDIESTTPEGRKRYIEVKSLQNEYAGFCITNNEYTAAHQFGDAYYICLLFEDRAIYIQNPLANLCFEKRIRQWEWFCERYSGEEIRIHFK